MKNVERSKKQLYRTTENHRFPSSAATGNSLDSMPLFEDWSQLDRFERKHHTELQNLTPDLSKNEMQEGYRRLLANSLAKDIDEPGDLNGPWNGWLN